MKSVEELQAEILRLVRELYEAGHKPKPFVAGQSKVSYAGRVYDEQEMMAFIESAMEFWITMGRNAIAFEKEFSTVLGVTHTMLTNSGSSANLLAVSALTSNELEDRLKPGDEVITPAATFPTTFNPLIQNNLKPVLLDVELGTYNIPAEKFEDAISDKTRLIMIPHTLGNPNEMDALTELAEKHDIYLIEDTCDALDSRYGGRMCGSFGDLSTYSFYAAHHITMGEGGAVCTSDDTLARLVRSFRDWGRACHCPPGEMKPMGACGNRFNFDCGGIPYDHRFMYSNIGYNLKLLDPQAAMGRVQLKKLEEFTRARKKNFAFLYDALSEFEDQFILPKSLPKADPSWFCFPLTIKDGAPFKRRELLTHLESNKIATRMLFAGNILRHPGYANVDVRVVGGLENTDKIMRDTFFIGIYPGLGEDHLTYVADKFKEFMGGARR